MDVWTCGSLEVWTCGRAASRVAVPSYDSSSRAPFVLKPRGCWPVRVLPGAVRRWCESVRLRGIRANQRTRQLPPRQVRVWLEIPPAIGLCAPTGNSNASSSPRAVAGRPPPVPPPCPADGGRNPVPSAQRVVSVREDRVEACRVTLHGRYPHESPGFDSFRSDALHFLPLRPRIGAANFACCHPALRACPPCAYWLTLPFLTYFALLHFQLETYFALPTFNFKLTLHFPLCTLNL